MVKAFLSDTPPYLSRAPPPATMRPPFGSQIVKPPPSYASSPISIRKRMRNDSNFRITKLFSMSGSAIQYCVEENRIFSVCDSHIPLLLCSSQLRGKMLDKLIYVFVKTRDFKHSPLLLVTRTLCPFLRPEKAPSSALQYQGIKKLSVNFVQRVLRSPSFPRNKEFFQIPQNREHH